MTDKRASAIDITTLKQKNAGKVQFNTARKDIFTLLDKGYSRRALHAVLHEKGLFAGLYRRFCEYVQDTENREHSKETPEPVLAALEKGSPVPSPTT